MPAAEPTGAKKDPLADPGLRRALEDFVRKRVPAPDVEDVVQTVLCDALAAESRPREPEELRRWLIGIARHKVVDHHRRASREQVAESPELPEPPVPPAPIEERELARWAEEQVGSAREGKQTLAWMAREGEGEKLESIAAEEQVPAARVRQRVSRMRRWMKERWMAELAAVAALAVLAILLARLFRKDPPEVAPRPEPTVAPEPQPSPLDRARALRAEALRACDAQAWQECLRKLDEAAGLDPEGDRAPEVAAARDRAQKALTPPPAPTPAPTSEKLEEKQKTRPITTTPTAPAPKPSPKEVFQKAQPKPKAKGGKTGVESIDFDMKK